MEAFCRGGCFAAREALVSTRLCRMWVYFLVDWHLVSFRVLDEGEFGKAQILTVNQMNIWTT